MKNKERLTNIIKNTVIAVLSLSAVYLLILAMNTSPMQLYEMLVIRSENAAVASETLSTENVLPTVPYTIVLTDTHDTYSAVHYAAKYDYDAKLRLYSQLSVALGEALGSATEPEKIAESDWRAALSERGVFFDYLYPKPLSLIALQLGTSFLESIGEAAACRLILSVNGDSCYLYFQNAGSGDSYRLKTALEEDSLAAFFAAIDLPTASFAFESEDDALPDPYFVFSSERLLIPAVQTLTPVLSDSDISAAMAAFGINERTSRPYSESDGSTVYVENTKNLRVSPTGDIAFTSSEAEGVLIKSSSESPTLVDCILTSAAIVSETIAPSDDSTEIGLSGIEGTTGSGNLVLYFCYYVNGIPVNTGKGGWCARVEISNHSIVRAELIYRSYTVQTGALVVLPEKQAAIEAASSGGIPQLFYTDTAGTVAAMWYSIY